MLGFVLSILDMLFIHVHVVVYMLTYWVLFSFISEGSNDILRIVYHKAASVVFMFYVHLKNIR